MQEKKINMSISEGAPFYAHEISLNFSPTQFIVDFKCVTPRLDPRSKDSPTINILHNVVMLNPLNAKLLHSLLGDMIAKYEKDFGKIEKSKALKLAEKKRKSTKKSKERTPNYFG